MIEFKLNGNKVSSAADVNTPLLWVIRDEFGFKGTKFGCGIGMCGACTVHMDGAPVRTCSFPLLAAANKNITTIEGLEGTTMWLLSVGTNYAGRHLVGKQSVTE